MNDLMRVLAELGVDAEGAADPAMDFDRVTEDSRQCDEHTLFVAIKGYQTDGHNYLEDAARRGAKVALVSDRKAKAPAGMQLVRVEETRRVLGPLAQSAAGDPSRKLDMVGVTGTNGKTTTVYLIEAILKACGRRPGLLSTVKVRWPGHEEDAAETTPSGSRIATLLARMAADGADSAAMEVSSHAIDQGRVGGMRFRAMALTNVTQDHLDYHQTMEAYAATKMSVFERMQETDDGGVAVVNLDDATGRTLAERLQGMGADANRLITYSLNRFEADLHAESMLLHDDGMRLNLNFRGRRFDLDSPLHCYFNAQNLLTGIGVGLALGLDPEGIAAGCAEFRGAPGRFEVIEGLEGVRVVVDYAHTPDAVEQVLLNARGLTRKRLIAVVGCGGDRDKTKRPKMGAAAARLAHELIITNDNPRTEDPAEIAKQIEAGFAEASANGAQRHRIILDRRVAIETAIAEARPGDTVVIAGKGHEDYQIVGTEKRQFDDREVAREAIAACREKAVAGK